MTIEEEQKKWEAGEISDTELLERIEAYTEAQKPAPPQEEQAAPPVIYTVDPMERPGWVDPDKKPTPPTLTKEDYTYSPGNVYEKYPGLTTAQYETLKSKITTEQQKQREEAAKTPQEKYEEYKTETLVPYLTETVGLMGTIGPEMKPPEKVEDYYSWQEESLDPWSSKVRKKEGEISQKKYETYKGETLIPFLRETGATIRPPHEVSAFQKWEETTFSPWIKDYETTQTAAQQEEHATWLHEVLYPGLKAAGYTSIPRIKAGEAVLPPEKLEEYGVWEEEHYKPYIAGEEKKAQVEYEGFLTGFDESLGQVKGDRGYITPPKSYKEYGKWEETFLAPALKQKEKAEFQKFVTSPFLETYAKREGKLEFFKERPEFYAKRIQRRIELESKKAAKEAKILAKEMTYGFTATGKLRHGFISAPSKGQGPPSPATQYKSFLGGDLLPSLKAMDYTGPAPPKSRLEYEKWTTGAFDPWAVKKGEEKARTDYIKGIEDLYKDQYDISPVTGPITAPKISTQEPFTWKLPTIKTIDIAAFISKELTPYQKVVAERKATREAARKLRPGIGQYESMLGDIQSFPVGKFEEPITFFDYDYKPLPTFVKEQPSFVDLFDLPAEQKVAMKKEGMVISGYHTFHTKKEAEKFLKERLSFEFGEGIKEVKETKRRETFIWGDLFSSALTGAGIGAGFGLVLGAPTGFGAPLVAVAGGIKGLTGGTLSYTGKYLQESYFPEVSPLPKLSDIDASAYVRPLEDIGLIRKAFVPKPVREWYEFGRKATQKGEVGYGVRASELWGVAAYSGGYYVAGKGLTALKDVGFPALTYRSVDFPTKKGAARLWKGYSVEAGGKAWPLFGKSAKGYAFGTPKIKVTPEAIEQFTKYTYQPATATERKIIAEGIRRSGAYAPGQLYEQELIVEKVFPYTSRITSHDIQKTFPKKTLYLTKKETAVAFKFFQEKKHLVKEIGGSISAEVQLPRGGTPGIQRIVARDIDPTWVKSVTTKQAQEFSKELAKRLTAAEGGRFEVGGLLIKKYIPGVARPVHVVDPHTFDMPAQIGAPTGKSVFGFSIDMKKIKVADLPTKSLAEQITRKGGSAIGFRQYGVGPAPHRFKDVVEPSGVINLGKYATGFKEWLPWKESSRLTARAALKEYAFLEGVDWLAAPTPIKVAYSLTTPATSSAFSSAMASVFTPSVIAAGFVSSAAGFDYSAPSSVGYSPGMVSYSPPSLSGVSILDVTSSYAAPSMTTPSRAITSYTSPSYTPPKYHIPSYMAPSKAPTYKVPSYDIPSYKVPSYQVAKISKPSKAPAYKEPKYDLPGYKPSYTAPSYKTPSLVADYKAPAYKAPSKVPSYKAPSKIPSYKQPSRAPRYTPSYKAPSRAVSSIAAPSYMAPSYTAASLTSMKTPSYKSPRYSPVIIPSPSPSSIWRPISYGISRTGLPKALIPSLDKKEGKVKKTQGFDVLVKRKQAKKGKGSYESRGYKKVNTRPLGKESAFNLGATTVDKFTNRSFFLKPSKSMVLADDYKAPKYMREKFRKKKGTRRIHTEKTKYAIDSYQEKQGIPYESARLRKAGLLISKPRKQPKVKTPKIKPMNFNFRSPRKTKKKKGKRISALDML